MQVRSDHAVSVGLIRWPHRPSRCTVVLKLAFGAGRQGDGTLLPDPVSVTVDRFGAGGILGAPSDFAPFKPRCDVVLVGADASGAGDARLTVHTDAQAEGRPGIDKVVKHARMLAARPTLGELSDPSDPAAEKLWQEAAFDFARFQCGAADQRVDFPRTWLAFRTEIAGARFGLTIPVGLSVLAVQSGVERAVAVQADGFLIDPAARRCSVSYRGVIDFGDLRDAGRTLVVSTQASALPGLLRAAPGSFRAGAAIDPRLLRRLVALGPEPADARRITRAPARTMRMSARTERLGRPAAPAAPPPLPPPPSPAMPAPSPPQDTIMLSTQDLLIVDIPSDEQLNAAQEARGVPPPAPAIPVQDTVTLARSDLAALEMPEESSDNEVTLDEDAARHIVDRVANVPSASEDLDDDSWSDSTLDRTPALSSRRQRPAEAESMIERCDTLTITGEAAAAGVVLPFDSQLAEIEASHTLTFSGEEADSIALPFARPKTVPPPRPHGAPPPPAPARVSQPAPPPPAYRSEAAPASAASSSIRLDLRPSSVPSSVPANEPGGNMARRVKGAALSLEQMMAIKRELFEAPEQRRAILAAHHLTGLEWRLAERSLARDLDDKSMNAERVRKLIGRP